jgi:hypothetical protein
MNSLHNIEILNKIDLISIYPDIKIIYEGEVKTSEKEYFYIATLQTDYVVFLIKNGHIDLFLDNKSRHELLDAFFRIIERDHDNELLRKQFYQSIISDWNFPF